ncbi:GDP-fucose synthetase [Microbulbifer sp. A4B17]|uniref:GDP-L-fucose synthase family protein n=1 Tax=Microbulbifer sp. A4B17 TaxID=359370 RepID=UPI000D52EA9D|nr:GDP-L-fucose synthase [Microbulbifer sp. A4B17]AWF81859.1 GDP-fucose synthetase [Microbulbifer sp. A4B17]
MKYSQRVFVAGHRGMVGSALIQRLRPVKNCEVITCPRDSLDLTDVDAVSDFFNSESIDTVYLAAAKVGGILANSKLPADFIYQNLMIQGNVIHQAHKADIQNLLFIGSSCIYPRNSPQPIREQDLLGGRLESTNEPYAIAKIAGIKLCESYSRQYGRNYRSVMPTNLYGPHDNFDSANSHVIPALIYRFHKAKNEGLQNVRIWGSGDVRREFLYVEDMVDALVFVMDLEDRVYRSVTEPMCSHLNVGTGVDCTVKELAYLIAEIIGFEGNITFDRSMPDGVSRKLLDTSKLSKLGWDSQTSLGVGLKKTYDWYRSILC